MNYVAIAIELQRNRGVFLNLLSGLHPEEYQWKHKPEDWNILEILCHLYDEERDDFRKRLRHVMDFPDIDMDPIDPTAWVLEKDYSGQDFNRMLAAFLNERDLSVNWLGTLKSPRWNNVHHHPKLGPVTAKMFFVNWLAHDYLHIRQILRRKHEYLKSVSGESLNYAGEW